MQACTSAMLSALVLAGALALHAQDQPTSSDAAGAIATDRPAVTNSSVVVPSGSLQVENGFLETGAQGQSVVDAPESLVRFGLARTTELRFTVPDYFHNLTSNGGSGFGDFAIGVKQQLGPMHGFDVSVIAFLSFPTGANSVSSGGYDPGLQLDCGGNVFGLLAYARPHTQRDGRRQFPYRSAIDEAMGRIHRICG
jgi:hypothetical protein